MRAPHHAVPRAYDRQQDVVARGAFENDAGLAGATEPSLVALGRGRVAGGSS